METKTFEIRDAATFIPVLAVKLRPGCEADRYLFGRAGYGIMPDQQAGYILLARIDGDDGKATSDPYGWGTSSKTMAVAHKHIIGHFDELPSGAVVDVEYIIGATRSPKVSERISEPLS